MASPPGVPRVRGASNRSAPHGLLSLVNYSTREITCKIVYYGPGRSGKTTNLHYIYGQVPEDRKGTMVSLATQTDRTLFFDFLPLDLGAISGFTTKFQLYTVPGQVYYQTTRKLVLQGADGVVFVADSQARQLDENIESFQDLHANLAEHGVNAREVPLVPAMDATVRAVVLCWPVIDPLGRYEYAKANREGDLSKAVRAVVRDCLGVREGEQVFGDSLPLPVGEGVGGWGPPL